MTDHYQDEDDGDGPTLRQVASRCCKIIDVGTAVLPKPLLIPDWDEAAANEDNKNMDRIPCATIDIPTQQDDVNQHHHHHHQPTKNKTRYANVLQKEFNSIVIEHHLKWTPLCHTQPGPISPDAPPTHRLGKYDFHYCDLLVDWALAHNMKVKGHVLVWHVTTPPFVEDLSPAQLRNELKRHIFTTMGHFRGRIKVWDVVNEALAPDGSLANNVFLRKLGPSYIEDSFRWAHEADPTAFLVYNDNKVEGMDGPNASKSDGYYRLLQNLVERDVPIHGAGMQAHFNAAGVGRQRPPTPRMVKNQIRRIGDLGLKVNISEMDVRVSKLPPNLRQIAQRQIYRDILMAALSEPSFDGIWLWGFTDRHTWVTHFYHDDEPLVFDEDYGRKESYYGMREALESIAPGGVVGGGNVPLGLDDLDGDGNSWGHMWMQPEPEEGDGSNAKTSSNSTKDVGDSRPDWLQT
mmetsp:Transcript_34972/g.52824  ORF Transcript_34972/g.52824 Transcript_34972/m.52824 type:complete len:461 (+) Transcript_34972:25-1407(+)